MNLYFLLVVHGRSSFKITSILISPLRYTISPVLFIVK
jgi:hypothetical protein